jgi:hypothetical protein
VLLIFVLLCTSVFAIEVKPINNPPRKPSSVELASGWVINHIWLLVIFLAIGGGIILFLYIWKKAVVKIDPFFVNWKKTKELCKLNRRWSIKDVYRVSGNTGLKWLGEYEGDCILDDGSINVMWSNWKWGFWGKLLRWVFFPLRPLLKLIMKDYSIIKAPFGEKEILSYNINEKIVGNEKVKVVEKTYGEKIIEYITFDDSGNCLVKAVGISKSKHFFYPVISNDKGEIVDTRIISFEKEQSDALLTGLYNLTQDFSNIMRERIALEPKVQYIRKTEGTEVSGAEQQ